MNKDELKVMARKTRKIMTMNRMYDLKKDTGRRYIPRMENGSGLLSIADCAETEEQDLSLNLGQSEERLLRVCKSEMILPENEGPVTTAKKQKNGERHKQWKEKHLDGKVYKRNRRSQK